MIRKTLTPLVLAGLLVGAPLAAMADSPSPGTNGSNPAMDTRNDGSSALPPGDANSRTRDGDNRNANDANGIPPQRSTDNAPGNGTDDNGTTGGGASEGSSNSSSAGGMGDGSGGG